MSKLPKVKRCKSRSSGAGGWGQWRCEKPRGHADFELDVVHKNSMLVWRDEPAVAESPFSRVFFNSPVTGRPMDLGKPISVTFKATDADESAEEQLASWWIDKANEEIARTVPKAVEYSATDLTDIGHDLARTMGREIDDEEAAELGVFFYLRGKVARWVGAVMNGQRVSDDTLFDIGVYVRMAQRIRAAGNWPGVDFHTNEAGAEPNYQNRSAG